MGRKKREWQEIEYVLRHFGKRIGEARKAYRSYVEKGVSLGRRPELVGRGLIRSLGGWDEVKKMRLSGQDRIKNFEKVLERVSTLFQLEKGYISGKGRQRNRVKARDLLCYWCVVELGMPMVDLAREFAITPAADPQY